MYELKKDISMPNAYFRAGTQMPKEEWEKKFPGAFTYSHNEWFIDLDKQEEEQSDPLREIVNEVFAEQKLNSISYKRAAEMCLKKYIHLQPKTYTKQEIYLKVIVFLKFKAQDHSHKYFTEEDIWDNWFEENFK